MAGIRLPMFPLSGVLFPHASLPLHVFESRYRVMLRECLETDRRFGVVLIERGSEVGGGDQRSSLGTRGVVVAAAALPDGRLLVEVQGEARIRIDEWLPDDPYPQALVEEAHAAADRVPGPLLEDATVRVRRVPRAPLRARRRAGSVPGHAPRRRRGRGARFLVSLCGRPRRRLRRATPFGHRFDLRAAQPSRRADGGHGTRSPPAVVLGMTSRRA